MHRLTALIALLLFSVVYTASAQRMELPEPVIDDPGLAERRELLISHGIMPVPEEMIRFLRQGFDEEGIPAGLPTEPRLKIQVVNETIAELGISGAEVAVPILIEIMERNPPPAVERILARDFEPIPIQRRKNQIDLARRMLSLNAVTALGLIGDEEAAGPVLETMRTESATGFTTKGAIALGQMGRNDGLASLVLLASQVDNPDSVAAFQAIYVLTGRNYDYGENTSLARRRQIVDDLRTWFENEGSELPVYRAEVLRRAANPPPPEIVDPQSLRGLLRQSRDVTDFDKRYAVREKLQQIAPARLDDLEKIARDPYEDLDIRRAAMVWLAATDPEEAKSIIKKLEDDENPVIARLAETMRDDIEDAIEYQDQNS